MRSTLGALLLTAALATSALAACADDGAGSRADDSSTSQRSGSSSPSPSPTSPGDSGSRSTSDSPAPSGAVEFTQIALISQTAAGGKTDPRPTVLTNRVRVRRFASQFERDDLAGRMLATIRKADLPTGHNFAAAVVSIGCDVPPGVTVQRQEGALAILPLKVKNPLQECLAPVTTVALVSIDRAAL